MRLVGDVTVAGSANPRIIRQNVTQDAVLRNFLSGELVSEPLQYILSLAHANRGWLPVWYYVQLSGMSVNEVVAALNAERPSQPTHRDRAVQRLLKKYSAFKVHSGTPKKILAAIMDGKTSEPKSVKDDSNFALAIQGLPDTVKDIQSLRSILLKVAERAQGNDPQTNGRRSNIFRAACRLDEILYGPSDLSKK